MTGSVIFIYFFRQSGELPWPSYWGITLALKGLNWVYTMALDTGSFHHLRRSLIFVFKGL
jgi:hypothetical protein